MFIVQIRTCPGLHENSLTPVRLCVLRMSGHCFSLMIWSFSPTSMSAELTLSSGLALERAAILRNLASETAPVNLTRLQTIDTAENN